MSNATMTMLAAPRPLGLLASAGTAWCAATAGYRAPAAMSVSLAHRIRPIDADTTPRNGRDGFVATKQAGPPRGVPR